MRSLYSGVSGLRVHQTKMDVIGNNIANVNTIGFKASSVQFTDILYQTTKTASGANASTGTAGTNAQQIGLGASVAAIKTSITTSGGAQRTDNATDLMINGNSFFVVSKAGSTYYTKAGSFTTDSAGNLATESGALVMGWKADANGNIVKTAVTNLDVMSEANQTAEPEATSKAYVTGNIDPADTNLKKGVDYQVSVFDNLGEKYTVKFKMTETTTAGVYSTSVADVVDSNGVSIFVKKDPATGLYSADTTVEIKLDALSIKAPSNASDVDSTTGEVKSVTATGTAPTVVFDAITGKFKNVTGTNATDATGTTTGTGTKINIPLIINNADQTFDVKTATGTSDRSIMIDYSTMTQYATTGTSNPQGYAGDTEGTGKGKKVGSLSGISIDTSGKIYGKYDNDTTKLLGQLSVASFSNPAGLESIGGNLFAATVNSGEFDGIGQEITQGGGSFTAGALEMSNVDLSKEFTEMITTQRGFQANSRIITTSDSMLEELVNLKR
jgi:flagellar hook protein FlgE